MIKETTLDNGELAIISSDDVYEILDTIIFGSKHDELRIHVKQQAYCISREQARELLPYLQRFVETGHIQDIKRANVTDLEKLINDLCELSSLEMDGNEAAEVHYAEYRTDEIYVVLENWKAEIFLDPTQALTLLDWLGSQRQNLEVLRDALQAQKTQEEATKAEREAERLTALKVKHSEAVAAWQQGGCVGPCPNFEDIANPKADMKFPMLEWLMQRQKERQS